jgi:hypothetical protein
MGFIFTYYFAVVGVITNDKQLNCNMIVGDNTNNGLTITVVNPLASMN